MQATLLSPRIGRISNNGAHRPPPPNALASAIIGDAVYLKHPATGSLIGFAVVAVNPEIAALVVGANYRKRRDHRVTYYARQMAAAMWRLTPQTISFYDNGERADGDHRLAAIIESKTTQTFLMTWGWSTDIFDVLDVGLPRQPIDYLRATLNPSMNNTQVGAVRLLALADVTTSAKSKFPNHVLADWCVILEDSLNFVHEHLARIKTKTGIYRSDVYAAMMANYYRNDRGKFTKFIDQLAFGIAYPGGIANDHEQNTLLLREDLMTNMRGDSGTDGRRRAIGKVETTIRNYMKGMRMSQPPRASSWEEAIRLPQHLQKQISEVSAAFEATLPTPETLID